jgi:hypothetical protein
VERKMLVEPFGEVFKAQPVLEDQWVYGIEKPRERKGMEGT